MFHCHPHITSFTLLAGQTKCQRAARAGLSHEGLRTRSGGQPQHHALPSMAQACGAQAGPGLVTRSPNNPSPANVTTQVQHSPRGSVQAQPASPGDIAIYSTGPRSRQEKLLVRMAGDSAGQQTYLKLSSDTAWVPGTSLKWAPGRTGRGCICGVTNGAGQGQPKPTVAHSPLAMRSLSPYVKHPMFIMTSFNSNHLCTSAGHLPWLLFLEQPLLQYLSSFFFNSCT